MTSSKQKTLVIGGDRSAVRSGGRRDIRSAGFILREYKAAHDPLNRTHS